MERLGNAIESAVTIPVSFVAEMIRIFPDGIVMGMGFFAALTASFPYGIFFLSLVESLGIFHGLRLLDTYLNISTAMQTKTAYTTKCISGFMSNTIQTLSLFGSGNQSAFPSAPIYIVSMASSYIMSILFRFSKELEVLGPNFSSRFYLAAISLPLFILSFVLFRLYFGCDDFGVLLTSIFIGGLIGVTLVEQNYRIFGLSSLNLIGIPFIKSRTADGKKLYVCPSQKGIPSSA